MLSRYSINRLKPLVYGPLDAARYAMLALSGKLRSLQSKAAALNSDTERLAFARSLFAPCQIDSEILAFLDWARSIEPVRILEVGVARGGTHFLLGSCISSVRQLVGVDLYPRNQKLLRALLPDSTRVHSFAGKSSAGATLNKVRDCLDGERFDLIFIDGDHSYVGAMADFNAYRTLLKPGGWAAFHDIQPQRKSADGVAINGFPVEVDRVWQELSAQFLHKSFIADPQQYSYGIGVLQLG